MLYIFKEDIRYINLIKWMKKNRKKNRKIRFRMKNYAGVERTTHNTEVQQCGSFGN